MKFYKIFLILNDNLPNRLDWGTTEKQDGKSEYDYRIELNKLDNFNTITLDSI